MPIEKEPDPQIAKDLFLYEEMMFLKAVRQGMGTLVARKWAQEQARDQLNQRAKQLEIDRMKKQSWGK